MRVEELMRAIAAFMAFSFGIAFFLVSLIVVIAAVGHMPIFSLLGVGGMVGGIYIMRMSGAIAVSQPIALAAGNESQ